MATSTATYVSVRTQPLPRSRRTSCPAYAAAAASGGAPSARRAPTAVPRQLIAPPILCLRRRS